MSNLLGNASVRDGGDDHGSVKDEIHHPILARLLDVSMRSMERFRARVVPEARGRVLEVGLGTGLNLSHYRDVIEVVGVEPDRAMRRRAERRSSDVPLTIVDALADALPFVDASFDTVVMTFVLCTITPPDAALAEARRVLKPDGTLLFAEHVRSASRTTARAQDILDVAWTRCAGGCHLNRDATALLDANGFVRSQTERRGSRWTLTPIVYGRARPRT